MTFPHLPYELWAKIAVLIPEENLRGLYNINSAFLEPSLNAKYRKVTLFKPDASRKVARNHLLHLTQPHIIHRICCIEVKLFGRSWGSPLVITRPSRTQSLHRRVTSKLPQSLQAILGSLSLLGLIEQLILNSRNAHSLDIHSFDDKSLANLVQIAVCALKHLGPKLDTLSFHGPVSIFSRVIKGFGVGRKLPKLRVFGTVLENEPYQTSYTRHFQLEDPDADAVDHWCRFLSAASPSLHSLDIRTNRFYSNSMSSYPHFFEALLKSFQPGSLRSFTLHVPEELIPSLVSPLHALLSSCSNSLRQVDIPPCNSPNTSTFTLDKVKFLTLTTPRWPGGVGPRTSTDILRASEIYLAQLPYLVSLYISSQPYLSEQRLDAFFGIENRQRGLFASIHHLDITVVSFGLGFLTAIAAAMPHLLELIVRAQGVVMDTNLEDYIVSSNMSHHSHVPNALAEWQLEYLRVELPCDATLAWEDEIRRVLQRLLPRLIYTVDITPTVFP